MDMIKISNKEIQFNIMMALLKIEGHLADMVTQGEKCSYDMEVELDDTSGLSK